MRTPEKPEPPDPKHPATPVVAEEEQEDRPRLLGALFSPDVQSLLAAVGFLVLLIGATLAVEWYREVAPVEEAPLVLRTGPTSGVSPVGPPPTAEPGEKQERPALVLEGGEGPEKEPANAPAPPRPSFLKGWLQHLGERLDQIPVPTSVRNVAMGLALVVSLLLARRRPGSPLVRGLALAFALVLVALGAVTLARELGLGTVPVSDLATADPEPPSGGGAEAGGAPGPSGPGEGGAPGGQEVAMSDAPPQAAPAAGPFQRFLGRHPWATESRCEPGQAPFAALLCRFQESRSGDTSLAAGSSPILQGGNGMAFLGSLSERLRDCHQKEQAPADPGAPPGDAPAPAPLDEQALAHGTLVVGASLRLPGVAGSCAATEANAASCAGAVWQVPCGQLHTRTWQALEGDPTWAPLAPWAQAWSQALGERIGRCTIEEIDRPMGPFLARDLRAWEEEAGRALEVLQGAGAAGRLSSDEKAALDIVAGERPGPALSAVGDLECHRLGEILAREEEVLPDQGPTVGTSDLVLLVLRATGERFLPL